MFLQLYENCQEVQKVNPLRNAELNLQKRHFGKEKGKKNSMPKEKNSLVPEDLLAEAQATIRKNPRKKNYLELSLSLLVFICFHKKCLEGINGSEKIILELKMQGATFTPMRCLEQSHTNRKKPSLLAGTLSPEAAH
jgi:hypothetical protein